MSISFFRWLVVAACLLAAAAFFSRAGWVEQPSRLVVAEVPSAFTAASGPTVKRIEEVRVTDYVVTDIADEVRQQAVGEEPAAWWDALDTHIDPAQWRVVDLTMAGASGERFEITLLRPLVWLKEVGAAEGGTIALSLPEQGVEGLATVLKITPCPPLNPALGRIVTGTITHVRDGILNVYLDGSDQPVGVTDNHPVYSLRHGDFVVAGALQSGDQLRRLDGTSATVSRIEPLAGEQRVYNLEVQSEHVYRVMAEGLLVHNGCVRPGSKGHPDHQAKVGELLDIAESQRLPGETVLREKQIQGFASRRRPDVQILDEKGVTRKIFEAERHPERLRNVLREADYDSLGIPHETHGL